MCAGALIASQGLITATLVREGHYIRMQLCLSIDRQMLDSVCKCFSAPYPTPPWGKYVTLNWLKHDCAMTVPGWIPLLVVANVTCIVLCCISGPDSHASTSPMLISIDDLNDLIRPFFISTVPLQPLMAYNCAEVVHFWSKHWKKGRRNNAEQSKTKLLEIYCFCLVTKVHKLLTYPGRHWFCQTVFWSLSPSLLLCDKQENIWINF